jgi:hypothetical protein
VQVMTGDLRFFSNSAYWYSQERKGGKMNEWTIPYDLTISSVGKPIEQIQGYFKVFQAEETLSDATQEHNEQG